MQAHAANIGLVARRVGFARGSFTSTGHPARRILALVPWLVDLAAVLLAFGCADGGPVAPPVPVASVIVEPDALTLTVGESHRLSAVARAANGGVLHGRRVNWSSANDSIVGVDDAGDAIAQRPGSVLLTATIEGKAGQTRITVRPVVQPVGRVDITPPGDVALSVGATRQLAAIAYAADGTELTDRPITWSSGNIAAATVSSSGVVQAIAAGSAVITATSEGKDAQITVTVLAPVARIEPATGGVVTLFTGDTQQLGVRAFAADGSELFGRPVTWSTGDAAIATVSATGIVQARTVGNAMVTAEVEGKTAPISIDVRSRVERIDLQPRELTLGTGEVDSIAATVRGAGGVVLDRGITWTSSNEAVATVDASGRVSAHAPGTAIIKAATEGFEGRTDVQVVAWSERQLLAIGDSAAPATLFTRTYTDNNGATRTVRVVAQHGSFRMIQTGANSGRYQLRFFVWIYSDAGSVQHGEYGYGGEWQYNLNAATFTLRSWNGETLTARTLKDRRLQITGRLEAGTPELTLYYAAAPWW